ncbi:AbiJ-NTD4 domain-containing protein [Candidatus Leptofilum sp.]|uniref:AbiJ-NTD4 domain-containing protein n=1 Tax=Candidatus Leptofilum sp. TaxID=3241576 RepID=UPI003B5B400C
MEQCKGQTKSGARCKRDAGASGFCHLHDPEKTAEREARKKREELIEFSIPTRKFSERTGFKSISSTIQIDNMNGDLRHSLWNVLNVYILLPYRKYHNESYNYKSISGFFTSLWFDYFKIPLDQMSRHQGQQVDHLWTYFQKCQWFEVYDFLEYVINYFGSTELVEGMNMILERELAGFRFIGGVCSNITGEQEIEMLSEATIDLDFPSVATHLRRALALLSDKKSPDYRNSIKESISAVESLANIITGTSTATLGDALKVLESKGELHPALKRSFLSLYGYTSNAHGIRHAMLEEPNLSAADAKFFLLSCTSFINYLKSKI